MSNANEISKRGGSNKLLAKLEDAAANNKYYEAHQHLKTIYFRYIASEKFNELENLLVKYANLILDKNQIESGADLSIHLAKLYKIGKLSVNAQRIEVVQGLLFKMPNNPERHSFIYEIVEWASSSPEHLSNFHSSVAQVHINERCFPEAWKHLVRVSNGKEAALLASTIMKEITLRRDEYDLVISILSVGFLITKNINGADEAFHTLVKMDLTRITPLINGTRLLIESSKMGNGNAFASIKQIYDPSFSRDPYLRKLVSTAGKSLFNLDRGEKKDSFLPSLLSAFLKPEQENLD